jgi:CcmD family protein
MDSNFTFMFYGFLAAWMVLIIYVIYIALRERKLREELERVKRMVDEREREPRK